MSIEDVKLQDNKSSQETVENTEWGHLTTLNTIKTIYQFNYHQNPSVMACKMWIAWLIIHLLQTFCTDKINNERRMIISA